MKKHNYIIGTGYHSRHGALGDAQAWFYHLWLENTLRYTEPLAIYVVGSGDGKRPDWTGWPVLPIYWLPILGDLGYCGDILSGRKPYHFAGAMMTWCTLAMIAYMNEADFLYKEQDVLAFGPYVEEMYSALGDKGWVFGNCRLMGATSSFSLVRHKHIPEVVRLYLGTPAENDPNQMPEAKFSRLQQAHPDLLCRYSFGVDRDRPFDVKAPVWYAQKFTREELLQLREAGLIEFDECPIVPGTFSNA